MMRRSRRSWWVGGAGLLLVTTLVLPEPAMSAVPGGRAASAAAPAGHLAAAGPAAVSQARARAATAIADHPAALRAGPHDAFVPRGQVLVDSLGTTHVRYDRTYRGLPVLGGDVVVHLAGDGTFRDASLTLARPVTVGATPAIARAAAVRAAVRAAARATGAANATSSRLVVDALGTSPALAWDAVVTGVRADGIPSRLHVIVDAATGTVRRTFDDIQAGTGRSLYSGQVAIGTSGSAGNYRMSDPARGGNYVTDVFGAVDPLPGQSGSKPTGTLLTDADDTWGNFTNGDRATAGVDAQYGAQTTWDYYKYIQGRNGIWNNGTGTRSRIHYGDSSSGAFWDGTQMTYSDGVNNAHPVVSLDVAGHEMTHGVTQNTAGLVYSGESGGLNESTSDVFGTMVESYANNPNDPPDYLIGEKDDLNGNGTPLRYMDRPSRDGISADCWSSGLGGRDPHYSSGPGNHAFYLMAEGSGPKTVNGVSYNSPTCNGTTVAPIGSYAAARIWYWALASYMTSGTTYAGARDAMVHSALDVYGQASAQCRGVVAAFAAINVTGARGCGTDIGSSLSCSGVGDSTFECYLAVSGGVPPYSVTWSGSGGVSFTYTDDGYATGFCNTGYTVTISAYVSDAGGGATSSSYPYYCSPAP